MGGKLLGAVQGRGPGRRAAQGGPPAELSPTRHDPPRTEPGSLRPLECGFGDPNRLHGSRSQRFCGLSAGSGGLWLGLLAHRPLRLFAADASPPVFATSSLMLGLAVADGAAAVAGDLRRRRGGRDARSLPRARRPVARLPCRAQRDRRGGGLAVGVVLQAWIADGIDLTRVKHTLRLFVVVVAAAAVGATVRAALRSVWRGDTSAAAWLPWSLAILRGWH